MALALVRASLATLYHGRGHHGGSGCGRETSHGETGSQSTGKGQPHSFMRALSQELVPSQGPMKVTAVPSEGSSLSDRITSHYTPPCRGPPSQHGHAKSKLSIHEPHPHRSPSPALPTWGPAAPQTRSSSVWRFISNDRRREDSCHIKPCVLSQYGHLTLLYWVIFQESFVTTFTSDYT
jgi:hypothetical protein